MASNNNRDNRQYMESVMKQLLAAVGNGVANGRSLGGEKPADSKDGADVGYGCRSLIDLFEAVQTPTAIFPGITARQQQNLILSTLKSSGLPVNSSHNEGNNSQNLQKTKRFFDGLRERIERIFEDDAYLSNQENREDEDDDIQRHQKSKNSVAEECQLFLKYAAMCVKAVLDGRAEHMKKDVDLMPSMSATAALRIPSQVYEVATYLHAMLFSLHSCGQSVESTVTAILELCESWWLANGEHREGLIVQCLPLLVLRACEEVPDMSNKSHIMRLYKLREAFACIDYSDASSDSLRSLLQRVASNPLCLKLPEGRKLLASLLTCDGILVRDLHMAFRSQIPNAKNTVLDAYGEIYHRAWKDAFTDDENNGINVYDDDEGDGDYEADNRDTDDKSLSDRDTSVRKSIEHLVLQDLMHASIHVASSAMQTSILHVLEPFHADKKTDHVANLLFRLYSPIVWRSLTAANPSIRCNALVILEKAFPLHNPKRSLISFSGQSSGTWTTKDAVLKATAAIQAALKDPYPQVRITASQAAARICAVYWEVLPSKEIHTLLNTIVVDHSSDSGSAAVRVGALDAFIILLGSAQTHAVIRNLLPALGNLIHDKSEKVRLATVRLLLCVKKVPGIRYYHVVPVDQLSARFVAEASIHRNPRSCVARELTALMINSYFPQGPTVSTTKQVKRTVTFLLTDPAAAFVFYSNLADHLELESVVKLISLLFSCLESAVRVEQDAQLKDAQKQKKRRRRPSLEEIVDADSIEMLSASNTSLMASLAQTIDSLWDSISDQLEKKANKDSRSTLQDIILGGNDMMSILSHFEQKGIENSSRANEEEVLCRKHSFETLSALISCTARFDSEATAEIRSFVTNSLITLSDDTSESVIALLCSYLAFLCKTVEGTEEMATFLSRAVEKSVGSDDFLDTSIEGSTLNRRRSSLRSSKSKSGERCGANLEFESCVAWNILEHVMQGVSNEGRAIRKAIIASDAATSHLQKAFQKGINFVERLLGAGMGDAFDNKQVEYGLMACEMYGRFALHRHMQASRTTASQEEEARFTRQFEVLIQFTSEKVLPAFLRSSDEGEADLRELNLSLITSRESLASPGSPTSSPPKQKVNAGRTPESIRNSTISMLDIHPSENDPAVTYSTKVAQSLLTNSCRVAAELVGMGTSYANASKASLEWCKALEAGGHESETLFRSMFVLAVHLSRYMDKHDLLVEVLTHYSADLDCSDLVEKAMAFLVRSRPDSIVKVYLSLADRLVKSDSPQNSSFSTSMDIDDVCADVDDSLQMLWATIVGNASACDKLANALARAIRDEANTEEDRQSRNLVFKINCLYALSPKIKNTASLANALDDLTDNKFEGAKREGMSAILDAVSAKA